MIHHLKHFLQTMARATLIPLILFVLPAVAPAQPSSLWTPKPRPAQCEMTDAQMQVLDISQSMQTNNLFGRAITEIEKYVNEAPPCTYVILGRFGTTADIVDDDYLTSPQARERLKNSLRKLRASHSSTNFDEAAKLFEWVQSKLWPATDNRVFLSVKVLTDDISSPDPDKKRFSLRDYFQHNTIASGVQVFEVNLTHSGTATTEVYKHEGYTEITSPVSVLHEFMQRTTGTNVGQQPASVAEGVAAAPAAVSSADNGLLIGIVVAIAMFAVALTIVLRRQGRQGAFQPDQPVEPATPTIDMPSALIITEQELPKEGMENEIRIIRHNERVPVAANASVVFGTDAARCTLVVAPIDGVESGEFVRITPTRGGLLYVKALQGVLHAGRPVPKKGLTLASNQPFRLRLRDREWIVRPSFTVNEQAPADELFARIGVHRTAVEQENHQEVHNA